MAVPLMCLQNQMIRKNILLKFWEIFELERDLSLDTNEFKIINKFLKNKA